jgi:hypothetical protein
LVQKVQPNDKSGKLLRGAREHPDTVRPKGCVLRPANEGEPW